MSYLLDIVVIKQGMSIKEMKLKMRKKSSYNAKNTMYFKCKNIAMVTTI
jgi:hypothetical protein